MQDLSFKNILVGLDGSEFSKNAFELAIEFYNSANLFEQIIITHITNKDKTYLPSQFEAEQIYDENKTKCIQLFPPDKYKVVFEEKHPDEPNCRNQILNLAEVLKASFLFIGFFGRKGVKVNQTQLTQTVKHCAYHSKVHLVITKNLCRRQNTQSKGFKFLVCVDGSLKSYQAVQVALSLATDKQDNLTICYAPTFDKIKFVKTIKASIDQNLVDKTKVKWSFTALEASEEPSVKILDYINNNSTEEFNFVLLGSNGYRSQVEDQKFFGSTAEKILLKTKSNVIIIT